MCQTNSHHPLCAVAVGALCAVGAATIFMAVSGRGCKMWKKIKNCACGCMEAAGNATDEIAREMKDCFCSDSSSASDNGSGNTSDSAGNNASGDRKNS